MKLEDEVAVVASGARGIGEAMARAYAAEGARVVIGDAETERARALAGLWRLSAKPGISAERR